MERDYKWKEAKIGPGSSVGIRISLQFNSLQTGEMLVASGPGHQVFPAWQHWAPSSLMHPGCCMAALVGPVVLEPLHTAVGAEPGICWDLPALGCFAAGLKALVEPWAPLCCFASLAQTAGSAAVGKCYPVSGRAVSRDDRALL